MIRLFKRKPVQSKPMPDLEVIQRVIGGEKALYEILMRRNNQTLYRVVRSYVRHESDIEDIMQSTYLKAYEKLYQFNHNASFSTWLIKIGINESLAHLRKNAKLISITSHSTAHKVPSSNEWHDNSQLNPEKKLIHGEAKLLLEKAIDDLDEAYRTVFMLREVEGMRITEIAECLDLSTSNVKVRLFRGRKMIKDYLLKAASGQDLFEFGSTKCDRLVEHILTSV